MNFPKYDKDSSVLISPSILSANAAAFANDMKIVEDYVDMYHIDVMDGHFVPNISFGLPVLKAIKQYSNKPFDVHLMISNPAEYIKDFVSCGADMISVHYETCPHLHRVIQAIKAEDVASGVVLNPATPISVLENILADIDMVLIMSVNPGFGGQKFIPSALEKISALRKMIDARGLEVHIEVDGGVGCDNAGEIIAAGANILVAGSAIFGASDPVEAIKNIRQCEQ